jgi:hypothetical protein
MTLADGLVKVVDLVKELARERRDEDRFVFTNCVEPAFVAIEWLHGDYMRTFQRYAAIIREEESLLGWPVLFAAIEADTSASETQRIRLNVTLGRCRTPALQPFKRAAATYIRHALRTLELEPYANATRLCLSAELHGVLKPGAQRLKQDAVRDEIRALSVLRRYSNALARRYSSVVDEYSRLQALLKL